MALKKHSLFRQDIDRDSLSGYTRYGYIGFDRTIYKDIKKLLPASYGTVSLAKTELQPCLYWSSSDLFNSNQDEQVPIKYGTAVQSIHSKLLSIVEGQMISDVPIGSFLSGGVDSSLITALMQRVSNIPVSTFSIGFHESDFNEAEYAKRVANHIGTEHTELYVSSQEVRDIIPKMPSVFSEPFSDSSQLPTYLVSQLTASQVKVALSGDAGDEVFSGYNRYKVAHSAWPKLSKIPLKLRKKLSNLILKQSPATWNKLSGIANQPRLGEKVHKAAQVLGCKEVKQLYLGLCSQWQNPNLLVLNSTEPHDDINNKILLNSLGATEYMMASDTISYLPGDILVKVDRSSMAHSLETRAPFLDHRLVEYAWTLPIDFKLRNGITKSPLRDILADYVPNNLIDRPKMGFAVPIGSWLINDLRDWAEDLLTYEKLQNDGFYNPAIIRKAWDEHISEEYNHEDKLWNILMFQSWLQVNS